MASHTSYDYQKPSTLATRSLVTGTKPTETSAAGSHDNDEAHDRPMLQRKTTDHYQQAVDTASKTSDAAGGTVESAAAEKPKLDRQQSWKHSDMKRGAMEKILGGGQSGTHGYTSTST